MAIKKIPCGGFYVDDNAIETREGKPYLKTGGSDEVLENAKATGGIGWTEQGEQTTIEWNGDTTGKVVVDGGSAGAWYLVSDKTPSVQDVIGGTFYISGFGEIEIEAESIMEVDNLYSFESGAFMVAFEPTTVGGLNFPYAGVYFSKDYINKTTSITYGTPDTVHKIDEKYINGGGGDEAVYFDVSYDGEDYALANGKKVQDIADAFELKPNVYIRCTDEGDEFIALVTENPATNDFIAVTGRKLFGAGNLENRYLQLYLLSYSG